MKYLETNSKIIIKANAKLKYIHGVRLGEREEALILDVEFKLGSFRKTKLDRTLYWYDWKTKETYREYLDAINVMIDSDEFLVEEVENIVDSYYKECSRDILEDNELSKILSKIKDKGKIEVEVEINFD